jgi:hypothetical protein
MTLFKENEVAETTLYYALEYFQKGFSVIPIVPRGKRPAIQSWDSNKTQRADRTQIVQWFSNSEYNIAIVTGRVSRILAFDIDGDAAKEHFYRVVEGLDDDSLRDIIHNTTFFKTGSSNTNLIIGFNPQDFQGDEEIKNAALWHNNDDMHSEIRLKAEGGYIVVPPSVHSTCNRYELINEISPATLSKEQLKKLITALNDDHNKKPFSSSIETRSFYRLDDNAVDTLVSVLKPYYKCGERNDLILYLSGWLRKKGVLIEHAQR